MKQKINGILAAMRAFDTVRKEQAQRQSDRNPFLPYQTTQNQAVAPLQGPANALPQDRCGCDTICKDCVEYQMTLNQSH